VVQEITSIIKERIENFDLKVDVEEVGKVIYSADGIAKVYGLTNAMAGEMVEFETCLLYTSPSPRD
jgi:F-type H+-transporting ATPase subunit alpha